MVMSLTRILSGSSVVVAIILFATNMPSAGFVALIVGTAIELVGAAITGKRRNV